jgi:hypothetical protein
MHTEMLLVNTMRCILFPVITVNVDSWRLIESNVMRLHLEPAAANSNPRASHALKVLGNLELTASQRSGDNVRRMAWKSVRASAVRVMLLQLLLCTTFSPVTAADKHKYEGYTVHVVFSNHLVRLK